MRKEYKLRCGYLLLNMPVISVLVFLVLPAFIVIPMSFGSSEYLKIPHVNFSLKWYSEFI